MKIDRNLLTTSDFSPELALFQSHLWARCIQKPPVEGSQNLRAGSIVVNSSSLSSRVVFDSAATRLRYRNILRFLAVEMARQGEPLCPAAMSHYNEVAFHMIAEAEEILVRLAPDAYDALRIYIQHILVVTCEDLVAVSSPAFLGDIAIAPKESWTVVDYIENLVHEASHIDLFVRQTIDPLVARESLLASPFRRRLRPAIGVFHAAFVLTRIAATLNILIKNNKHVQRATMRFIEICSLLGWVLPELEKKRILRPSEGRS